MNAHAAHAAEYFWWTARSDISCHKVTKADLLASLNDEEDADYAFSLFDLDGDGYVVEEEVQSRFQHIYRCALACLGPLSALSGVSDRGAGSLTVAAEVAAALFVVNP